MWLADGPSVVRWRLLTWLAGVHRSNPEGQRSPPWERQPAEIAESVGGGLPDAAAAAAVVAAAVVAAAAGVGLWNAAAAAPPVGVDAAAAAEGLDAAELAALEAAVSAPHLAYPLGEEEAAICTAFVAASAEAVAAAAAETAAAVETDAEGCAWQGSPPFRAKADHSSHPHQSLVLRHLKPPPGQRIPGHKAHGREQEGHMAKGLPQQRQQQPWPGLPFAVAKPAAGGGAASALHPAAMVSTTDSKEYSPRAQG